MDDQTDLETAVEKIKEHRAACLSACRKEIQDALRKYGCDLKARVVIESPGKVEAFVECVLGDNQ
jgi:hypothetical protein